MLWRRVVFPIFTIVENISCPDQILRKLSILVSTGIERMAQTVFSVFTVISQL